MQGNLFENNVEFTEYLNEYELCKKNKNSPTGVYPYKKYRCTNGV